MLRNSSSKHIFVSSVYKFSFIRFVRKSVKGKNRPFEIPKITLVVGLSRFESQKILVVHRRPANFNLYPQSVRIVVTGWTTYPIVHSSREKSLVRNVVCDKQPIMWQQIDADPTGENPFEVNYTLKGGRVKRVRKELKAFRRKELH